MVLVRAMDEWWRWNKTSRAIQTRYKTLRPSQRKQSTMRTRCWNGSSCSNKSNHKSVKKFPPPLKSTSLIESPSLTDDEIEKKTVVKTVVYQCVVSDSLNRWRWCGTVLPPTEKKS